MRNLIQVREAITAKLAEVEAIQAVARSENRELAADEAGKIDAILGAGDKPGELDALRAEEARAIKLENATREALARMQSPGQQQIANDGSTKTRVEVPSSVRQPAVINLGRGVMNRREQEEHAYGFGQFIAASLFNSEKARQWCSDKGLVIRNAMTEGFDSKGGVLVPEQYESSIIRLVNEYGVARQEFGVQVMTSDTKPLARRQSGLTAYYPGEGGTITPSDLGLDQARLTARKLAVLARHSVELGEDAAISLGDLLSTEAALAIAVAEDSAGFIGDGTSTYGRIVGLRNALLAGSEVTAATGNTSFGTLDKEDFQAMIAKVQTYAITRRNAKWYISRAGWAASMARLMMAEGGNTAATLADGLPQTFMGFPVVWVEVMNSTLTPQTNTEGLCFFGDARQSVAFGDRRGMAMAVSNDVYFTTDETAIRWTTRYDINVHDCGTASASGGIVQLNTPGS